MPANSLSLALGDMRRPIKLYIRSDTQDVSGGETDSLTGQTSDIGGGTYTPMFGGVNVFASDKIKRSSPQDVGGKLVTVTSHTYTIRYHRSILAAMPNVYVSDANYPRYSLVTGAYDPDGERHFLSLITEDVEG